MSLRDYVAIFVRRWRLIAVVFVGFLLLALIITGLQTRLYRSGTTLYVSAQDVGSGGTIAAYQGGLLSEQRVKSYTELITSGRVAQDVVRATGVPLSSSQLQSEITASAPVDTSLINVEVVDESPQRAALLADAVGKTTSDLVGQLEAPSTPGARQPVTIRTVQPATVSANPVSPKSLVNLIIGAIVGLAAAFGLALAQHMLDTTIRSGRRLEEVAGMPVIGSIELDTEIGAEGLFLSARPNSGPSESVRQLRTNIGFLGVDNRRQIIAMTSAVAEEGKSTTLCNLAEALAQAGNKVLVVEADLRRPKAAAYLGLANDVGLTNLLVGRLSMHQATQRPGRANFDLIASGKLPPNPSELLGSRAMVDLLDELRNHYTYILIDLPPVLPVTDATVLAPNADGVVVICRYGKTPLQHVASACNSLRSVFEGPMGAVLTMVPIKASTYYGGYGRYATDAAMVASQEQTAQRAAPMPESNGDKNGYVHRPRRSAQPSPRPRS